MEVHEQVAAEFDCKCPNRMLVTWTDSKGSTYYGLQCRQCGDVSPLKRNEMAGRFHPSQASQKNETLRKNWWAQRSARYDELRKNELDAENQIFRAAYNIHMRSPRWAELRSLVMERCGGLCEGCRKRKAVQVHHLTYRDMGNEFLWQLVGICLECHNRFHDSDSS
jgi:5-methylcytosine-specific restriction endonuclease McrA